MKRKAILIKENTHKLLTKEMKRRKKEGEMCSIGSIASEYIERAFIELWFKTNDQTE